MPLRGPSGYSLVRLIERRDNNAPQTVTEYHARGLMVRITELVDANKARAKPSAPPFGTEISKPSSPV